MFYIYVTVFVCFSALTQSVGWVEETACGLYEPVPIVPESYDTRGGEDSMVKRPPQVRLGNGRWNESGSRGGYYSSVEEDFSEAHSKSPVYTIQPVVKPVVKPGVQPDWQPVVSCKRGLSQRCARHGSLGTLTRYTHIQTVCLMCTIIFCTHMMQMHVL